MKIRRMAAALMTAVFCCHAAACALKPIQNGGTSAEVTELPDEQTFDALSNEIFMVNRLDELYARHDSVSFLFKSDYSEFPEYYLWETPDVFYCEDSCGSKYCDRDDLFRQIAYDEQTGIFDMSCGVEFDSFGSQGYSFVPETVEEFYIKAHETPKGVVEKDGLIYMTTTADEELSGEIMERYGLEHSGQTVETTLVADAASMELQYYSITMISGDEEKLLDEVYFKYDEPAPVGYLNLRAAFEGGGAPVVELEQELQEPVLLGGGGVGIDRVEGVLMEVILPDRPRGLEL